MAFECRLLGVVRLSVIGRFVFLESAISRRFVWDFSEIWICGLYIYSAIAFVLFLFGCEEEYDKSGIYSVDIVTMNKTDAYAVVDYRTLCGSGRLDTVPPHSKTVNKILIWDTHLVTDSMWLESEQRFEYVPDKDSRVYTPAEFTLNYYRGTNMDGRLVLSSMNKKKVVYFKRIEPNQIWGIEIP